MQLHSDAWRQYSIETVHRLILLMELGVRPSMGQQEDYSSTDAAGPSNFNLAAAAAAELQAVLGTMTEDTVLPNSEAWNEIEAVFDKYFKFGFLSLLVNPNALVEACATNFVSQSKQLLLMEGRWWDILGGPHATAAKANSSMLCVQWTHRLCVGCVQ